MNHGSATFDEEADIVVVGYGGAGVAAAITAADLGASVYVVEKQTRQEHWPSSRVATVVMYVTDVEQATEYFERCADGMVPRPVSRAWAERAVQLPDWFDRVAGLRLEPVRGAQHPQFEGAEALKVTLPVPCESNIHVEQRPDPFGIPIVGGVRPQSTHCSTR